MNKKCILIFSLNLYRNFYKKSGMMLFNVRIENGVLMCYPFGKGHVFYNLIYGGKSNAYKYCSSSKNLIL